MTTPRRYSRRGILGLTVALATAGCLSTDARTRVEADSEFDPDFLRRWRVSNSANNRRRNGSCRRLDSNRCFEVRVWVTETIDTVQGRTRGDEVVVSRDVADAESVTIEGERVNRFTLELAVMDEGDRVERTVVFLRNGEIVARTRVTSHFVEDHGLLG